MRRSTVLAAAFAAGVTTFAARAEDIGKESEQHAAIEAAIRLEASREREEPNDASAGTPMETALLKTAGEAGATGKAEEVALADSSRGVMSEEAGKAGRLAAALAARKSPGGRYGTIIAHYASTYGVPVLLANAIVQVESNFRPDARGSAGEIGLMQIKPATARLMGYSGSNDDLFHPETNIKFGMKYLGKAHRLGGGTICGTILKYNAGHAAKRMNPISSAYCSKVKRLTGI